MNHNPARTRDHTPAHPSFLRPGRTALITGASSGLGAAYAARFAAAGVNLILCARSTDALTTLAEDLRATHTPTFPDLRITVLPADLTDPAARAALPSRIADAGLVVDILLNNAGFGTRGDFHSIDPARAQREIELNCTALTHLCGLFLPAMRTRGHGAIINIASTAAFQPIPTMAVYAATKSFVLSFTQALWHEQRGSGVRILAVCPGPTATNFFTIADAAPAPTTSGSASASPAASPSATASAPRPGRTPRGMRQPEQVVDSTLAALDSSRPSPVVIDGVANTVSARLAQLSPKRLVMHLARAVMRR